MTQRKGWLAPLFVVKFSYYEKPTTIKLYKKGWEHQQLILPIDTEIIIPEQDPVRLTSAQLEELDYRKLYRAYSAKGRKSAVEPRIMFEVLVYGYMCGIYSSRDIEEACRKRVDFMWLLDGEPVPDHTTIG